MKKNSGKIWPYAISTAIALVVAAGVATVVISIKTPVENSDAFMMNYHEADAKANDLIEARIAFDKKYKIQYIADSLDCNGCVIKYKVSDLNSKQVSDANITVVLTRPDGHKYDKELNNPTIENGIYSFDSVKLEKEGRWDIMAKVSVGDLQRYYNVKADTRAKEAYEY
ncbi:MAG: FixH family protein [Sulfurimonas sp.]